MSEIKLVIFDCDGVLVDSEYLVARLEAETYGRYGFELGWREFGARFAGLTGAEIFRTVEAELGTPLPKDLHIRMEQEIDTLLRNEVEMVPGAADVLDRIDQPRCICSNSGPERLEFMLRRTGLYDRFRPHIFSAADLDPPAPKPSPGVFLKALATFGHPGTATLTIEDSVHGVTAARLAGTRVVGFTGGRHSYPGHSDSLTEAGAETVIHSFGDLPAVIDALSAWSEASAV